MPSSRASTTISPDVPRRTSGIVVLEVTVRVRDTSVRDPGTGTASGDTRTGGAVTGWRTEDAMITRTETGPRAAAIQETDLVIQEDFPRNDHPEIGEKAGEDSGVVAGAEVVTAVVAGDEAAEVSTEEAAAVAGAEDVGAGE